MLELLGIFVGHIYFFLKFRYAQDFGGPDLLQTPQVIMKFILLWKKVELGSWDSRELADKIVLKFENVAAKPFFFDFCFFLNLNDYKYNCQKMG